MSNEAKKHLEVILRKMCRMVGANYNSMNFKESNWFHKHSWTEEEESEFKKWLIKYFNDHVEARHALMKFPLKKYVKESAQSFIFNYGWKLKENKNE